MDGPANYTTAGVTNGRPHGIRIQNRSKNKIQIQIKTLPGNPANLTCGPNESGWAVMAYRPGDINYNGTIDNGEVPVTTGPYLLWTAGPDMIFGNDDDVMCDGTQLQQIQGPLPTSLMRH